MSLSSDFYNEQQKKKTPSQVATGVNNGTSASSQFLDSVNKGAFKLVVSAAATTTKPTVTPTQKPNIFQSAVDSIKKIADTAIAGLTGQNKQQPVVAPIEKTTPTTQPISSEIKNLPLAGMGTQSIFSSQKNVFDNIPSPSATFKNPLSSNPKAPVSQITQTITNAISSNLPVTSDLFSQLTSEPDIHKAIGNAWSTYSGSILNEAQAMRKYMDTYTNPKSSEIAKVGSNLELISGTAGVFFAPISALFSAAVDIPVVAPTARLINIAFSALGEGATVISNKIVDELPISAKDKAQIKPGLGEIFALAAQIGVGTVIGLKTKDTLTEKYGTTDANTIIDQAKTMAQAENQALVQRVVNGTGSLQDIATYKKLAASGKLREFTQSGHGGYLPSEVGQNVVFTPEQLTSHIEGTDLKGTPLAKEIDSVIKVAQDSNKSIQVITNPPSGIDTFKNPTPQGNKLGYVLTQPVKITLLSEQGGAASRTEVVPQVAPVANAGLYDTGKTPESALMQVGKYANNDYNKITSQVTKDLGYVDEQGVKRINGIERAKEIDKRVAENVNNQRQAENDLYHSLQPQYKIGDTVRMQHVSQPGSYSIVKQGVDGKFTEVPNKLEIGKPIEVKITQARFDTQQSLGQLNRTDFPSSFKLSTLEGKNVKTGESIEIYPRYLVNGKPLQDTIKIKSEDILSKMLKQGKLGSSSNESRVPQPTTPPSPTKVVAKTQAQKTTPPPVTVKSTEELLTYIDRQGHRTPEQIATLKADIIKNGIVYPIELIDNGDGTFEINDGTHRIQIAADLGIKELPIKIVKTKEPAKKPSFTSKEAQVAQADFTKKLDKLRTTAKNQEDLIKQATVVVDAEIAKYEADHKALAGVRTSISKEMFGQVGKSGNYKADYAQLQILMEDPAIGKYLNLLEDKIVQIDEKLQTKDPVYKTGGINAEKSGYAELQNLTTGKSYFKAIEFPELVTLAKELMGKVPEIKRASAMRGARGRAYSDMRIKLNAEIFKDPVTAAKTLSHELGHIADFLPDGIGSRGNLVGRIATLNKHLKNLYGELDNKVIRAELLALSKEWKPFDIKKSSESYVKYRSKPAELYADAISVLFNDPVRLKESAPEFYKGFFEYLDRKPTVKDNFFAIQDLLNQSEEAVFNKRNEELNKAYQKAEDVWAAKILERQNQKTNIIHALRTLFDDKNYQLNRRVQDQIKSGAKIEDSKNPMFNYEALNYFDAKIKNFVADNFQPAYVKAAEIQGGWETLGKILQMERSINERGDLANPGGYDPKTAQDFLDGLKKSMPEADWNKLQEVKDLFRKGMDAVIKQAEDNGYYKPEMITEMKANKSYATFQVIDYLDTYISPAIRQQVGTLKDVANPATSSIMKAVSTLRAIESNNAKRNAIDFQKEFYKDEIQPAKTTFNGKFQQVLDSKEPGIEKVVIIRDGKVEGYYLDKGLADILNRTSSDIVQLASKISRKMTGSPIYRPLFTTINLGFQTFNFTRDFMRYWKNTPDFSFKDSLLSFPRAGVRYLQAAPHAYREVAGKPDAIIKAMENQEILGMTYNDMFVNPDQQDAKQIERVMHKAGVLEMNQKRNILTPIYYTLEKLQLFGDFIERLPKIAAYIELKDKLPQKELAHFIRNYVGSPNFRTQGTLTPISNNIFMFSNAIKEGIKSDFKIATGRYKGSSRKQSRSGFWWKNVISTFIPKLIMLAMVTGLLGEELKKQMENVSEYDKTNYITIPLGIQGIKTIYLRVPQDETGRLLGGIFWKMSAPVRNEKVQVSDIFDIFAFNAGQLPNLVPSINGAGAIVDYLSGNNPYDSYRNRNVIPDKEFQAGFKYSFPIFFNWLLQNQGLGIIVPSYQPQGKTSTLENLINAPGISNIVGRWIKVSNYGQTEQNKKVTAPVKQAAAAKSVEENNKLDAAIQAYQSGSKSIVSKLRLQNQLVKDVLGNPPYNSKEKLDRTLLIKKFQVGVVKGVNDPDVNSLISAVSTNEKIALLQSIAAGKNTSEMNKFLSDMRKQKILSDQAIKDYRKVKK